VAVVATQQQRILVAGSRIQVEKHRMPVAAGRPIAPTWVSTVSTATMRSPEDKPLTHNMG